MDEFEDRIRAAMHHLGPAPLRNDVAAAMVSGRRMVTRRRILRTGVVAGVTAIALVGVLAAMGELTPQPAIPSQMPPATELPSKVSRPSLPPPSLPDDTAVGRGLLVYNWGALLGETHVLVMSDGRQYRLPEYGTISPDGAWYGYLGRDGVYRVRQLTGTRVWEVRGGHSLSRYLWSPDSRWLVLVNSDDRPQGMEQQGTKRATVLDLRTGRTHVVAGIDPLRYIPVAILPNGELVYGVGVGESAIRGDKVNVLELRRVDVRSGKAGAPLRVDLSRWLRRDERIRTTEGPQALGFTWFHIVISLGLGSAGYPGTDEAGERQVACQHRAHIQRRIPRRCMRVGWGDLRRSDPSGGRPQRAAHHRPRDGAQPRLPDNYRRLRPS